MISTVAYGIGAAMTLSSVPLIWILKVWFFSKQRSSMMVTFMQLSAPSVLPDGKNRLSGTEKSNVSVVEQSMGE